MNITREVIIDLWPVYTSGEASADTRALIEEFLQNDPEFARQLEQQPNGELLRPVVPNLPPDREVQALNKTKRELFGWDWSLLLLIQSMGITSMAIAQIISGTSWDVSPRNFIITAVIATVSWCVYIIRRLWVRRTFYHKDTKPGV